MTEHSTLNGGHSVLCSLNADVSAGFKFTASENKDNNVGEQFVSKK
jgi:hypothetical protein